MYEILIESKTFEGLNIEELKNVLAKINFHVKKYDTGDMIYQAGEKIEDLVILIRGKVATEMMNFSGKSIKISKMKAPDPIADAIAFSSGKTIPVNVEAIEPVEMLTIHKEELMKLFSLEPRILENYMKSMADRAVQLTQKIFILSLKTIKGKIAMYLMRQSKGRDEFEIKHTQTELASLFGIARPSLAREISQMVEEGIIEAERRKIKILDKRALQELVE